MQSKPMWRAHYDHMTMSSLWSHDHNCKCQCKLINISPSGNKSIVAEGSEKNGPHVILCDKSPCLTSKPSTIEENFSKTLVFTNL